MNNTFLFVIVIIVIILFLYLICSNYNSEPFEPVLNSTSPNNELMNRFEIFRQQNNIPGVQINILKNNSKVYSSNHSATGVKIWDTIVDIIVQDTTLFRIASVTKTITAIAILQLVNQSKLNLDDKMINYLLSSGLITEDMVYDQQMYLITIRDLLQHSGGWDTEMGLNLSVPYAKNIYPNIINDNFLSPFDPQYDALKSASSNINSLATTEDLIRFMMHFPLNFAPGTREKYSNFGYNILGRIIEIVSKEPYSEYVRINIFEQLDLTYPPYIGSEQIIFRNPQEILYYDGDQDMQYSVDPTVTYKVPLSYGTFKLSVMDSHGGWVMTAADIAKIGAAMMDLKFFNQEIFNEIFKRPSYVDPNAKTFYTLGMSVSYLPDGDIMLSHNGALTFGTFAFIGMFPNKKISVGVITNHLNTDVGNMLQTFTNLISTQAVKL